MDRLLVSPSPHIKSQDTTKAIMLKVVAALLPSVIAGTYLFGFGALLVVAVCVASCVVTEALMCKVMKRDISVGDMSAVVTGLILGLNLTATFPIWMAIITSVFTIVIVKMLFGGLGQNVVNPAVAGRLFVAVSFPAAFSYIAPRGVDMVSEATPLMADTQIPLMDAFLGLKSGAIGEVSTLAILIGFVFLVVTKVIKPTIPVAYIGTVFVLSELLGRDGLYQILIGGVMFGAVFMATDYVTSPTTARGKIVFAVGCGLLTVLIRFYGNTPEGTAMSILFMNLCVPFIDRFTTRKVFGIGGKTS